MNLTDDDILKFLKGSPIFLEDVCAIYPATLREIIDEGYSKFQSYLAVLTAEKPVSIDTSDEELSKLLEQLTDFQYILMMTSTDPRMYQTFLDAFRFFTHEKEITILLDPAQIVIGSLEENHFLDEGRFHDFQRILRRMYFVEVEGEEIVINDDDPPSVRKLKMQMRKNRERVSRAKAKRSKQSGGELKFSDLVASLPFQECGLNLVNIWDITYYAFYDQLRRGGWHEQFDINNRAAMAGAKMNKSQLKHWMRSIASYDKA